MKKILSTLLFLAVAFTAQAQTLAAVSGTPVPKKSAEAIADELKSGDILLIRMGRKNAAEEIEQYLRARFEK